MFDMPSITPVSISNIALKELSQNTITTLDPPDGSPMSVLVSVFYPLALDMALTAHEWNFAVRRRAGLAAHGNPPAWGFKYAYTYPANCLRALEIAKNGCTYAGPWKVELDADEDERVIVTDLAPPIDIRFISRITDTQLFSPLFVLAFSKMLKALLAKPCTGKDVIKQTAEQEFATMLRMAQGIDGVEGSEDDYTTTELEGVR